jgi:hypothetical protein
VYAHEFRSVGWLRAVLFSSVSEDNETEITEGRQVARRLDPNADKAVELVESQVAGGVWLLGIFSHLPFALSISGGREGTALSASGMALLPSQFNPFCRSLRRYQCGSCILCFLFI